MAAAACGGREVKSQTGTEAMLFTCLTGGVAPGSSHARWWLLIVIAVIVLLGLLFRPFGRL
jgi:hypothetical protein